MNTTEVVVPKITELRVTYSVGVKANIGNYESADAHLSRGETWQVEDLSLEDADTFYAGRMGAMRQELGRQVETEYKELKS
jgi:hypothetical protein